MGILDKKKEYWGALSKKNGEIQRIQIMSKNYAGIYKVFKSKRKVTFMTNADTIHVEGVGNVGTIVDLWEGEHVITFSKPDHRTEKVIIVVAEEDLTVEKYLIRTHGQLNIHSSPSGANVYINNANMGVTPLRLNSFAFGSYAVSLTKSGYYTDTFNVAFNTHPQTVNRTLTQIPTPPPPPYVPPPEPPVIPGVPNPTKPPRCESMYSQVIPLTKTSAVFKSESMSTMVPAVGFDLYLDGKLITSIIASSCSYMVYNLVSGRTYTARIVMHCNNGGVMDMNHTFTMPR